MFADPRIYNLLPVILRSLAPTPCLAPGGGQQGKSSLRSLASESEHRIGATNGIAVQFSANFMVCHRVQEKEASGMLHEQHTEPGCAHAAVGHVLHVDPDLVSRHGRPQTPGIGKDASLFPAEPCQRLKFKHEPLSIFLASQEYMHASSCKVALLSSIDDVRPILAHSVYSGQPAYLTPPKP